MHFPSHVRQSLLDWLDANLPTDAAFVEANYERSKVLAEDMLRRFIAPTACSDRFPKDYAVRVASLLDYDGPTHDMTYALAASALLTALTSGPVAASHYLESVLIDARERRLFGPPAAEWWAGLDDADRQAFLDAGHDLSFELARKLESAGVRVVYGSWSDGPFYPVWPLRILSYVSRRRAEAA